MRKLALVAFGLVLLLAPLQAATGTVTVTGPFDDVYTIAWTSGSGTVSDHPFTVHRGMIAQVTFIPGSGGTQPTDLYDVTLVDANGTDLLNGLGADRSNTPSGTASSPNVITELNILLKTGTTLDLVVANAGTSKTGTVYVWVR